MPRHIFYAKITNGDKNYTKRNKKGEMENGRKKITDYLADGCLPKLEEMSKTASQKKSAVIIAAINLMYAKQQQPTTKIESQAVIM